MTRTNQYKIMARSGFKLKSGNSTGASSFKAMGATPVQSPMQLGGLYKLGKLIYRGITGTTKVKRKTDKIRNISDEIVDLTLKTKKTGGLTSQSIKKYKKLNDAITAHNKGVKQVPIRYGGSDIVIDAITGYQGSKIWWDDETSTLQGTDDSSDFEGTHGTTSEDDTSWKVFEGVNYDKNTNQFTTED